MFDYDRQEKRTDGQDNLFMMLLQRAQHLAVSEVQWEGLPEVYNGRDIEVFSFLYRQCCIDDWMGRPTVCRMSTLPDRMNLYGMPVKAMVTYPDLHTEEKDLFSVAAPEGVVPFYDTMIPGHGRIDTVAYWAGRYCDAQTTIDTQIYTQRTPILMAGTNRQSVQLQERMVVDLATGVKALCLPENVVSEVKVLDLNAPWNVPDLVQWQAEALRRMYAGIGVDASSWQKKERMVVDEQESNDESLSLVIQDMLSSRRMSCELLNQKYGWDVTADIITPTRVESETDTDDGPGDDEDGDI